MTTTFVIPTIPPILTKKDWDKKKGLVAKAAGKTGIGDECALLAGAWQKVKWDVLDLPERRRVVLKNWRDDSFTKDNWNRLLKVAVAEVNGNVTRLATRAQVLRDKCQDVAADFKKSKTIPASSAAHVAAMAREAEAYRVRVSSPAMNDWLRTANQEFLEHVNQVFVDPLWPALRKYAADHSNLIAQLRADPTPSKLNNEGMTGARDLATGVGNLAKVGERGFGKGAAGAAKLHEALTPWANTTGTLVSSTASREEVLALVDEMEPVIVAALKFARSGK